MAKRMVPMSPKDGKIYAMQNGKWVEIDAEDSLGFTPENVTNKVTTITASSTNTQYPKQKRYMI